MKKPLKLFVILLMGILGGCNMPQAGQISGVTSTPSQVPTPVPTPTPQPTPTPLPVIRITQGDQAILYGDYNRALQEYQTALDEAPDQETQAASLLGIGRSQFLLGDFDKAHQALITLLENYPDNPSRADAYYFLGRNYLAVKDYVNAAISFENFVKEKPGILDAYVDEQRGDALSAAGRYQEAINAYQAAVQAPQLGDNPGLNIKIGQMYAAMHDNARAAQVYMDVYNKATDDYVKAQANLYAGQAYLAMDQTEQAYARFQDSVNNFPRSYDSYSALIVLVDAGVPINDLNRGLVDYFAGKYGVASDAFIRYLKNTPEHDGTAHFYLGLCLRNIDLLTDAIVEFDALINEHSGDRFFAAAWDEKAYTYWPVMDKFEDAVQIYTDYGRLFPDSPEAPGYLFEAGRIWERNDRLEEAATTWLRMMEEYPSAEISYRALFLAAIQYYRLAQFTQSQTIFQRLLVLAINPEDQAAAYFWIGKTQQSVNDLAAATSSWEQAVQSDPTGYYSERARDVLLSRSPFNASSVFDLGFDLENEKREAETWLRNTFSVPAETALSGFGNLAGDARLQRGDALWQVGLYREASLEFDAIRAQYLQDPVVNFLLVDYFVKLGAYRQAIVASRQILDLVHMENASTLDAPIYFTHIRFGPYYKDLVLPAAQNEGFHPLFLFSVIRQESLFEGHIQSSAGAGGLMQLIPDTAQEVVSELEWPKNYTDSDRFRPLINIPLGAHYLAHQRDAFDGNITFALAAYNAGPGNALAWQNVVQGDSDLFLEVIRFDETRLYIKQIAEFMYIYRRVYERAS